MFQAGDIVKVLVPIAVGDGYDYRLTAPADVGAFVRVSVMNRPLVGVIVGAGDSNLPPEKIKSAVPSSFILHPSSLCWLARMSEWTMMQPGAVLRLILNVPEAFDPPKTEQLYAFAPPEKMRKTDQRQAIADAFASNDGEPMSAADIQHIARVSPAVIRTMIKSEILTPTSKKISNQQSAISNYYDTGTVKLNAEQQTAADLIAPPVGGGSGRNPVGGAPSINCLPVGNQASPRPAPQGTPLQRRGEFSVHLLDGITGSGKTQVYFDTAWRVYAAGRSVLLMMPEIALTAQFMDRFAARFGAKPTVWHSNLTMAKRRDIWRGVAAGEIRMVVGTRSALFLPWQDLGLIVVDEEHDASYKQEDMGNYHARDMAILRAHIENFPVVLASATPSAETIKKVSEGAYKCSRLTSRFGGATMPAIELIDMRHERPEAY